MNMSTDAARAFAPIPARSTTHSPPLSPASSPSHVPTPYAGRALAELRCAIERIDETLIAVIAERMTLAREVGRVKAETGQPVTDPAREAAVVARAAQLARNAALPEDDIRELYWRLIAMSRRAQISG